MAEQREKMGFAADERERDRIVLGLIARFLSGMDGVEVLRGPHGEVNIMTRVGEAFWEGYTRIKVETSL